MRSVDAATLLNGLNGTTSLAPIIGAFLSDAYLGRYLALAIASVASLIVSFLPSFPSLPCLTMLVDLGFWGRRSIRAENSFDRPRVVVVLVGDSRVRFSFVGAVVIYSS
jgi:hypothetical protein